MADENKVVNYEGNKVSLFAPEKGAQRDIAYVRPGDEVELNFDIRDQEAIKVEVVKGDLHIIFQNGSTLTLASMAAIGFSEDAPKLRTLDGKVLSLEEFLSVTEVLNYNEAVLILANENQVEYSDAEPKVVQVSSDQDAENDAGIPITGQGNSDLVSQGVPTEVVDPNGVVSSINPSVSTGPFVSTIWTTNSPYNLDKTNYLPGDTTDRNLPNLDVSVLYGSSLDSVGTQEMNGVTFSTYEFKSGKEVSDDPLSQLDRRVVNNTSGDNVFVNNSSENMDYIFRMNYTKGVFPSRIEIKVPKDVAGFVELTEGDGLAFSGKSEDAEGNTVYSISNINPQGLMDFLLSFPENTQITNFELTYTISYLDPSTGNTETVSSSTSLTLYPVTEEGHVQKSNGYVLSTHANPVDVTTGSGDDVIVGGGGSNIIKSGAGKDRIFTYTGDDVVEAGDGDDEVWGSAGSDLLDGGNGSDTLYYDNKNVGIDPTGNSFKDSYYKTNKSASGLFTYLGFEAKELKEFAGENFKNSRYLTDNSILVKKSQGVDVVNNFETINLSGYNDTVTISDKVNLGNIKINGGELETGKTDVDTLTIDDSFVDAKIYLGSVNSGAGSEVKNSAGQTLATFVNFEQVKGSKNNDTFYGGIIAGITGTDTAIAIDGGAGDQDVLTYEDLTGTLEFNANTGFVQKKDNSGGDAGVDKIRNIEIIEGSGGADTFYGSYSNNYTYRNLGPTDLVSYELATSGVTLVIDGTADFNIYKTSNYTSFSLIPSDIYKDVLQGSLALGNLSLSKRKDVIIITDETKNYTINAGEGKDVLSYAELSQGITVTFDNGDQGTVDKGGVKDTFDIMINDKNVNIYQIIGTEHDDTFVMDDSTNNKFGLSLDGGKSDASSKNTLSYANVTTGGVSFNFSGGGNSTVVRAGSNYADYFVNFQEFIGSGQNDNVIFSSSVTIDQINGLSFNLGGGTDVVNYSQLSSSESAFIEISFNNGVMTIAYDKGATSNFTETEGVVGTAGNDHFKAADIAEALYFDGFNGVDIADYSAVATDLVFRMNITSGENVERGGVLKDTLKNVEHIKGGTVSNLFYLASNVSYIIEGNTAASTNAVSYLKSNSGITLDLETNKVTKGTGAGQRQDELINITSIKGSEKDDSFLVSNTMITGSYDLYGNDATIFEKAPANDTDVINFAALSSAIDLMLDTSADDNHNEYDANGNIIKEGFTAITANGVNFNLYHIEGIIGTAEGDKFTIISSYSGAKNFSSWNIDGGAGEDTVDYSQDTNLGVVKTNPSGVDYWDTTIKVSLSGTGVTVNRGYTETPNVNFYARDVLKNVETILLSDKDDIVTIDTGWESSGVTKIDAGVRNSDPGTLANGDTLDFSGIADEILVEFDVTPTFGAQIVGNPAVLPEFDNFDNVSLSKGKSTVKFKDNSDFRSSTITITAASEQSSTPILDFTALTSELTIHLGQRTDPLLRDYLSGAIRGEIKFATRGAKYTVQLSDQANTIFGSDYKNMIFTGAGNQNTLDYTNVDTLGVEIDFANKQVKKNASNANIDSFDESFTTIKGTTLADTFLITKADIDLTNTTVNLGGEAGDKILIDVDNAIYDIAKTLLSSGANSVDISSVVGVEIISFGAKNDKIAFTADYDNATGPSAYAIYDGGEGDNTLDFSAMDTIIFSARDGDKLGRISKTSNVNEQYTSIVWDQGNSTSGAKDLEFRRFYNVIGAANASMFYAQINGNYNYTGGAGTDTLSYSQSSGAVNIMLLSGEIEKNGTKDTFKDIEKIEGTVLKDTVTINQFTAAPTGITVDGGTRDRNSVKFDFDAASGVNVEMTFDANGDTSFDLVKGGTTQTVDTNFVNFQEYELTENNDKVIRDSSLAEGVTIRGGAGTDEIIYTGSGDIVFNAARARVTRGTAEDILNQMEIITYQGTGTATFIGNGTSDYTYKGNSTLSTWTTDSAVIDYSAGSSYNIVVDFALNNGLMKITKGGVNIDYFDGYITKIIGTKGDDTFILAERNANLPKIRIEGSEGTDRVSYENLTGNGATFIVDANGQVVVDPNSGGGISFAGYEIDGTTIEGFTLTKGNDTFQGNFNTSINIDGGDGIDTLDYSALGTGYSVSIDFNTGDIRKIDNTGAVQVDKFSNFESIVTGDSDDTIIINDSIISGGNSGNVEVGGGTNTLDASNVTHGMIVDYGADFKATIDYGTGTPYTYNGFQEITLGKGSNVVNYTHSTAYETLPNPLKFTSYLGSKDEFNFKGAGATFFIDATDNNLYNVDTASTMNSIFLVLNYFSTLSAKNTTNELHIEASGLTGEKIFWGGTGAADSITYDNTSFGLVATMVGNGTGNYIEIKDANGRFVDKLYNIENITLSGVDDKFVVGDVGDYTGSGTNVIVDGNGGTNNEVSFENITTGGEFDAGDKNFTYAGYEFKNFQSKSLTGGDDTVYFTETGSSIINANTGNDTADFKTKSSFTDGVSISVVGASGDKTISVEKRESGELDQLKNFENFILTDKDDVFSYTGTGDGFASNIHFDMGAGTDTVDFSGLEASVSGTEFEFDGSTLTVKNTANPTGSIQYSFENMESIIMGGTGSSLKLKDLPSGSSNVTFDGGDASFGTNLDLSDLAQGSDITVDLYDESVKDSSGNALGLSFKNFRAVTGSSKIIMYSMTERNKNNEDVGYVITTNNDQATISYDNEGIFGGISAVIDTDTEITKDNGAVDTIKNSQFGTIVGTNEDDTFSFKAEWKSGLTIDAGEGVQDVLNFTDLSSDTSHVVKLDKPTSEITSTVNSKNATFRNFTRIQGSSSNSMTFTIDLTGIAASYQGISIVGGTTTGNAFVVTGTVPAGTSATLSVADTGVGVYTTNISTYSVSVSIEKMQTIDLSSSAIDTNVELVDYTKSGINKILANASSNNSLDIKGKPSHVSINDATFRLENGSGTVITEASGFNSLILGNQQDIITISGASSNSSLVIDSGGSNSATPDQLIVDGSSVDRAVVLNGENIQVYDKANPNANTDAFTTATRFPVINIQSNDASLYITSLTTGLSNIDTITHEKNTGKLYLVNDLSLTTGSFSTAATLSLENLSIAALSVGSNTSVNLKGFVDYYLGNASDTVILNGADQSTLKYKVDGGEGDNVLKMVSWNSGAFITVNNDTTTYNRTSSEVNFEAKNLTNIDLSGVADSSSKLDYKVSVSSILDAKYNFTSIEVLEFKAGMANSGLNEVTLDGKTAQFSSATGASIFATWKSDVNPIVTWESSVQLDNDFFATVLKLSNNNGQGGFHAPNVTAGHVTRLDASSMQITPVLGQDYYEVDMNAIENAISYHQSGGSANFYNFSEYLFAQGNHHFIYDDAKEDLVKNWTLQAGAGTNQEITFAGGSTSKFELFNGSIIRDTDTGNEHKWSGITNWGGLTSIKLNVSEEEAQSMKYEANQENGSNLRSSKVNYVQEGAGKEYNVFADQTTYTLTEGRDTVDISEVKNNTVVDTMAGKDDIIFSGNAAYYSVEHFQDKFITIDGKQYSTGGNYLVVTDDSGNKMYILNTGLEDILAGGQFKYDEEGNLVSSGFQFEGDNYNGNIRVENEKSSSSRSEEDSNAYFSKGDSDGATSYGRRSSSFSFEENSNDDSQDNNVDSSEKPQFELIEDEGLDLSFDDEVNLGEEENQENTSENEKAEQEIVDDSNDVVDANDDEDSLDDLLNGDQPQQNQTISDEELMDMISQTFSREDDSLDSIDITLDLDTASIDMSSINENLVEETVIQESDVDSYKLESERNEDGTLKIHNQNGSNGNGGLGF